MKATSLFGGGRAAHSYTEGVHIDNLVWKPPARKAKSGCDSGFGIGTSINSRVEGVWVGLYSDGLNGASALPLSRESVSQKL